MSAMAKPNLVISVVFLVTFGSDGGPFGQVVPGFYDGATLRAKFRDRIFDFVQRTLFSFCHHALEVMP